MYKLHTPFSSPIVEMNVNANPYVDQLNSFNIDASNNQSFQTNILDQLPDLKKVITDGVKTYTSEVMKITNSLVLTQSWISLIKSKQPLQRHYHANSMISGVYYFEGDTSLITFHSNNFSHFNKFFDFDYEQYNIYNTSSINMQCEPGTLIIFPSSLEHSAFNDTNSVRKCVAFNTYVQGIIGNKKGKTNLCLTIK